MSPESRLGQRAADNVHDHLSVAEETMSHCIAGNRSSQLQTRLSMSFVLAVHRTWRC